MPITRRDATRLLPALASPFGAAAQPPQRPVLLELFTSQGCSSCPPADALLGELARRPDVVALGFHVDYWDRLGWRDPFSLALATERQRRYAALFGLRNIYTPQLVVDGAAEMIGSDQAAVARALAAPRAPATVPILMRRDGAEVTVGVAAGQVVFPAAVLLATYQRGATTRVARGENAGRTLTDTNAVLRLDVLGQWSGTPQAWRVPAEGGLGYAAFAQGADGRVLGLAALTAA